MELGTHLQFDLATLRFRFLLCSLISLMNIIVMVRGVHFHQLQPLFVSGGA
ncbi:hypothetical protein HanXRQr2_Chr14g0622201 [Helianthus annuus]|uniref:Uncharacterized protein n=1 Tax=Helianthus annuus TaxID=4232 RepID=A0A9K3E7F4_HELAN|nr:hypothetical protein HanXRQr2_Chr14g0622201 [Helianthus annuus]KAJ0462852.1 hypothetical protein HanHA300_Chr14g0508651 [Helianthus annuus]KAJ0484191.1 hypothetical protein HanHA89_Chr14g0541361 [Helianthus annuus]KAJ0654755.1 hypothetical protein HanLR1_Chr14g0510701 [Helianthus annuus]KAJ0658493.1 hypothetical protein HanOQP8_Chr14g0508851 [Helianthus annuus]